MGLAEAVVVLEDLKAFTGNVRRWLNLPILMLRTEGESREKRGRELLLCLLFPRFLFIDC